MKLRSIVTAALLAVLAVALPGCLGAGTNAGQQQGNPNGRNVNVQGPYIETLDVTVNVPPNADSIDLALLADWADEIEHADQDITSQPAATGSAEGGDLASGNQVPVGVGGSQPTTGDLSNTAPGSAAPPGSSPTPGPVPVPGAGE